MLVLTRKSNQRIRIGEDITIVVKKVKGSYVQIGIDAPSELLILRDELCEGKHEPCPSKNPTNQPASSPSA